MATPTSDQGIQCEFFSPRKLLNEAISSITQTLEICQPYCRSKENLILKVKENFSKGKLEESFVTHKMADLSRNIQLTLSSTP